MYNPIPPIQDADIEKQADYGTFVLSRTASEIIFSNYTGYTVICKPYVTTPEGKAGESSLYSWLNYALEMHDELLSHKDEINPQLGVKNEDWLNAVQILTEANLTRPCVVFTDTDYAVGEANKHIEWLNEKMKLLYETMNAEPPSADPKADAGEFARAVAQDNLDNVLNNERTEEE